MYNGYQYDRHMCAIVGRMLDKHELIRDLETFEYPPMDPSSHPHDLLVFSISLENWTLAARRALGMSEAEKINLWNLDCVGEMGISPTAFIEHSNPNAIFELDGGRLLVYGDIEFGFYERFHQELQKHNEIEVVALGSGGGSVRDAILSGLEIRRRGLSTTIYGNCFSACPLVFMGGKERALWASPHRLGFHQIYLGDVIHPH